MYVHCTGQCQGSKAMKDLFGENAEGLLALRGFVLMQEDRSNAQVRNLWCVSRHKAWLGLGQAGGLGLLC